MASAVSHAHDAAPSAHRLPDRPRAPQKQPAPHATPGRTPAEKPGGGAAASDKKQKNGQAGQAGRAATPTLRPGGAKPAKSLSDPESPSKDAAGRKKTPAKPKPAQTADETGNRASGKPPANGGRSGAGRKGHNRSSSFSAGTGIPELDAQIARQNQASNPNHNAAAAHTIPPVPPGFSAGTGIPELDMEIARAQAQASTSMPSSSTPVKQPRAPGPAKSATVSGKFDHFYAAGTWTNSPAPSALPIPAFKREGGTPKPSPDADGSPLFSSDPAGRSPEMRAGTPGSRTRLVDDAFNPFAPGPSAPAAPQTSPAMFHMEIDAPAAPRTDLSDRERAEKSLQLMNLLQSPAPQAAPSPAKPHPLVEMWDREASSSAAAAPALGPVLVPLVTQPPPPKKDPSLDDATGALKSLLRIS
ncbi:hypothetical protein DFJ74DRAFT_688708 [Hyaloraphidium curvatum]|nr:hypothetical protein DFJ74DRAFT_688708 [Hyaloraphidium curvatum]